MARQQNNFRQGFDHILVLPLVLYLLVVLALILMRKRLLKYEQTQREGDSEIWQMRLMKDRSEHSVANPRLTDDQIEDVSRQLGAILHTDAGEFADQADSLTQGNEEQTG